MKSCGNCENCFKASNDNWTCEEYGFYKNGNAPVHCEPPYDEPCEFWTDDPKKANTLERYV